MPCRSLFGADLCGDPQLGQPVPAAAKLLPKYAQWHSAQHKRPRVEGAIGRGDAEAEPAPGGADVDETRGVHSPPRFEFRRELARAESDASGEDNK